MTRRFKRWTAGGYILLALALGCLPARPPSTEPLLPVIADDLDPASLRGAIRHSVAFLQQLPPGHLVGMEPRRVTAQQILAALIMFEQILLKHGHCARCFAREIETRFDVVPSSADAVVSDILFTGYYQPVIEGNLVPTPEYRYPIYATPPDLIIAEQVTVQPALSREKIVGRVDGEQFLPYYTRREIDELGALRGRGLEIAWVKDPIDLFFLHIQGSGIVNLPSGERLHIGYAAQNGWPYRSIGRLLIDTGKIAQEEMSMQRLRRYLTEYPDERSGIFAYNESYVFFRVNSEGPLGSLEVPVTAGRSIATDRRLFPRGALAFIRTEIPVIGPGGELEGWHPIARFVLNQDTGGAIRGFQRADLFFGTGKKAAELAGYMNRRGKLFFLFLKEAPAGKLSAPGAEKNNVPKPYAR